MSEFYEQLKLIIIDAAMREDAGDIVDFDVETKKAFSLFTSMVEECEPKDNYDELDGFQLCDEYKSNLLKALGKGEYDS